MKNNQEEGHPATKPLKKLLETETKNETYEQYSIHSTEKCFVMHESLYNSIYTRTSINKLFTSLTFKLQAKNPPLPPPSNS